MSKYIPLWEYVQGQGKDSLLLTHEQIGEIAGVPIDHSFLSFKKELLDYGYKVAKISLKEKTVLFEKVEK